MIWIKVIHIAGVAVWGAGLISLPGLYVQRTHIVDPPALHRLHAMVRFLYVALMSPAAFLSVASGTALVFMRETFEPWFSLKLLLVGGLATIHILTGRVILRLFDEGEVYPTWRFVAVTAATLLVIVLILFVVLAKPEIPLEPPEFMREPGALKRLLLAFIPFPRS